MTNLNNHNFSKEYYRKFIYRMKTFALIVIVCLILAITGYYFFLKGNIQLSNAPESISIEYEIYGETKCFTNTQNNSSINCQSEKKPIPITKLIIGDSLATSFYAGVFNKTNDNWAVFSGPGFVPWHSLYSETFQSLSGYIQSNPQINEVWFVFSARLLDPESAIYAYVEKRYKIYEENILASFKKVVSQTQSKERKIYFLKSPPSLISDPKVCITKPFGVFTPKFMNSGCNREKKKVDIIYKRYNQIVQDIHLEIPQLEILDSTPIFCDEKTCSVVRNEKSLFNSTLLSVHGATEVYKYLKSSMQIK